MNHQDFFKLYKKTNDDTDVVPFQNEAGFSIVRNYPENSEYSKSGLVMFIKIALEPEGIFYSVDMSRQEVENEKTFFIIEDSRRFKRKVTNFISDAQNLEFSFDANEQKLRHNKTSQLYSVNEFVDILAYNHLSDRLYWPRKLSSALNLLLKFLFWIVDMRYDSIKTSVDKYHFSKGDEKIIDVVPSSDPIFSYFNIPRNFLFSLFILLFAMSFFGYFFFNEVNYNVSNPTIILFIIVMLFFSEKMSLILKKHINTFLKPEKIHFQSKKPANFIDWAHNRVRQFGVKFDLKIPRKIPTPPTP